MKRDLWVLVPSFASSFLKCHCRWDRLYSLYADPVCSFCTWHDVFTHIHIWMSHGTLSAQIVFAVSAHDMTYLVFAHIHIWMSHVTLSAQIMLSLSAHDMTHLHTFTYEWVMLHMWECCVTHEGVVTYFHTFTYEWVMLHMWMCCVTHMKASWRICTHVVRAGIYVSKRKSNIWAI